MPPYWLHTRESVLPYPKIETFPKLPILWHYTGRNNSDLKFIKKCMIRIPKERQSDVVKEYDRLFNAGKGRKEANIYLHGEASIYEKQRLEQLALKA